MKKLVALNFILALNRYHKNNLMLNDLFNTYIDD